MNLSISEQLTYSTVRIECELKTGGTSTGTGFFFNFLEDKTNNTHVPVVVTNKHVIKNASKGKLIITKANEKGEPIDTQHFTIAFDNFESFWRLHPEADVDLCAMPIAPFVNEAQKSGDKLFYIPFTKDLLLTEKHKDELTAIEDVLMIGYPNGIWDSVNTMPIFRHGTTATHPLIDYNGKKEIMIENNSLKEKNSYLEEKMKQLINDNIERMKKLKETYELKQNKLEENIQTIETPIETESVVINI